MMRRLCYLLVLFLLEILSLVCIDGKILLVHSDRWNQQYGSPGVRLRLTKKGAEHLKTVAVKLLNEQLASLNGFRVKSPFSATGLEGFIEVDQIRTLRYLPPQGAHISFHPNTYMVLSIENAGISLAGRFLGSAGVFQVPGYVHGDLNGMSVSMVVSFKATQDGLMAVNVLNCSTIIYQSQFYLEPEGPLGPVVKTFEAQINDVIRQRIPNLFCKGLGEIIEKNSPNLFKRLTAAKLSEHFQGFNSSSVIEKFIRRFTDGLLIDNRYIADPVVTTEYFETQQRGELKYENTAGNAPFYPRPMVAEIDSEKMLYMYASEYTLNSLLYHAYESDRLGIKIEQANLPDKYKGFVRTICDDKIEFDSDVVSGICVGKLIPAIAEHFPNTTTKFVLLPHGLPEVRFFDNVSSMDVRTRILTYVDENGHDKQILVSSADGIADIKLKADDGKFSGDLKLRKLNVRLHRSAIDGINPESISELAPLAKTFLGPELARGLKQGLPYPLKDSIAFINPELTIHDGYARLATDFILGETKLREKMTEAFNHIKNSI
uniref:Lipid-binding serum glycoprotein C-terminal domain-containing protein n=2 Tax=Acrobeloides nanus TaxID=290746 RepID=A0A914CDS3_9BILA